MPGHFNPNVRRRSQDRRFVMGSAVDCSGERFQSADWRDESKNLSRYGVIHHKDESKFVFNYLQIRRFLNRMALLVRGTGNFRVK